MKGELETEKVSIDTVKPHPKNVRQGDIGAICESLQAHGQYRAIVVQRSSGHILAGNHTWKAAKQLGWTEITTHFIDCDDDQAMRILLADNRANDLASYDDAALAALLHELSITDAGLAGTLFDGDALDDLISKIGEPAEADDTPDSAPAITQLGDIWLLGNHRLMCGDSLDAATLDRLMNGAKADCIMTDPPYGMALETDYKKMHKNGGGTWKPVIGDDKPFDPTFQMDYFHNVAEQWWWGADYYRKQIPDGGSWLVWDKRFHETMQLEQALGNHFELAWTKQKHLRVVLRHLWAGHHGMQREDTKQRVHPTQKPTALIADIFARWVKPKALVVDLFAGSGSTLIACEITDRTCYTIELDPQYCDVICARYEKQTGNKPRLEATGEEHTFLS